jgi:hypothetical protein
MCWMISGYSQLPHPKVSPFQQTEQHIGLSSVKVRYSRPAVRGRQVYGDLVPYGRIWRVGANESTKITLSDTMQVGPHKVPSGTYALYAFPSENSWEVVFHRDTTHWGDGRDAYRASDDLFRYRVVPEPWSEPQENFVITFDNITHNGMDMLWIWDRTCIRIPISTDTRSTMIRVIGQALQTNPAAQTYYEAARYLQEEGLEYVTALEYIDRALELGGDTYYYYRVKSLILAGLGSYPEAVVAASRSKSLAAKEGKDEFVRMNQKNIELWSNMN